jgi:hypothetical protein
VSVTFFFMRVFDLKGKLLLAGEQLTETISLPTPLKAEREVILELRVLLARDTRWAAAGHQVRPSTDIYQGLRGSHPKPAPNSNGLLYVWRDKRYISLV